MLLATFLPFIALSLLPSSSALNIILTNDDSWASANIRATHAALKKAGHDVVMVAPAVNQSGKGGTVVLPTSNITAPGGEFGTISVGAPYYGHDANDSSIWYFSGTPAACVLYALDFIAPAHFGTQQVDLVVSGPNEGQNVGEFLFTLSGTVGATYTAVGRGIPAVAFSAGNSTHRSYTTNTGLPADPANIAAKLVVELVAALSKGVKTPKERLLPLGLGVSVNIPTFGPASNCTAPPFVLTRLTGGAITDKLVLDKSTGLPTYAALSTDAINKPLNGNARLPGETTISQGCKTAVSVFAIDYDAPNSFAAPVQSRLKPLFGKVHFRG